MEPKPRVIRIRRHLVVYFDKSLRLEFDKLAFKSGLRAAGDPPCDAELARVLIIAQLLAGRPGELAVAAALRSNAVISLSRRLAVLARDLVPDVARIVEEIGPGPRPDPPERPGRAEEGSQGGRPRVCLILDDWTHKLLVAHANRYPEAYNGESIASPSGKTRPCAPDMALVRSVLETALKQPAACLPVVVGYASAIRRVEEELGHALDRERERISKLLLGDDGAKSPTS